MKTLKTTGAGRGSRALSIIMTIAVCGWLVAISGISLAVWQTARAHHLQLEVERYERLAKPQISMKWRPDVTKCPKDIPLWDCIRHAMYREDI